MSDGLTVSLDPRGQLLNETSSRFKPWRFVVMSLTCIFLGFPAAFGHSSPTAGHIHWRGAIVSFIVTCVCTGCFLRSPRRPRMPKSIALILVVLPLSSFLLSGCSTPPKLTAQDRRQDIEYLANWARDCEIPLAAFGEKHKDFPSWEALRPKYLQLAEEAANNEDFYLVTAAYFNVVGAGACHAYLLDEEFLKWSAIGRCLGICDWGLSAGQLWAGTYWPRLASGLCTRVHPPFRVSAKAGRYYLEEHYQAGDRKVPRNSEIIKVNGMSCASYLAFIKSNSILRYEAFPQDWMDNYLLVVDEGPQVHGWSLEFLLPDGTTLQSFVPKVAGFPPSTDLARSVDAKENCTCIELTDAVGYIRIRSMWHGPVGYVFKGYIKKERQRIRQFLEQAGGRYKKLIIDIRDNGGGTPEYVYQNLVCPFLKGPVTFKQTSGMKERYLAGLKPKALHDLKKQYDLYITVTRRVEAPAGFPDEGWVWQEVTRQLRPSEYYHFEGKLYVLVNGGSFSAADDYADLVRRLGLGTLVGQKTGGGSGGYLAPGIVRLPRSGMIFRAETKILVPRGGSVDELFGTSPDVQLPPSARPASITRADLLKDEWIKHILMKP